MSMSRLSIILEKAEICKANNINGFNLGDTLNLNPSTPDRMMID